MSSFLYVQTEAELSGMLDNILNEPITGVDTETTGLDPYTSDLLLFQISTSSMTYVINMLADHSLNRKDRSSPVWKKMIAYITGDNLKIGHNWAFDFKVIKHYFGVNVVNLFDTMLAERLLTVGKTVNKLPSLAELSKKYLNKVLDKSVRVQFHQGYITKDFSEAQIEYAANDTSLLIPLFWCLLEGLQKEELIGVADLEFSIIPIVAMMEYRGININLKRWKENIARAEEKRLLVRKEIEEFLKPVQRKKGLWDVCTIDVDSPKQLLEALHRLPGLENLPSTNKNIIRKYVNKHPIIKLLLKYRQYTKLCTSYGDSLLNKINPITNRLHGSFSQLGTDTGRFSSSSPNLQQIPATSDFRSCFVAPEGYKIVGADYSQQELRVVASLSREQAMLDAYKQDKDLHTRTAALIFSRDEIELHNLIQSCKRKQSEGLDTEITKEELEAVSQRSIAKSVNFLIIYGGGHTTLAFNADLSENYAREIIDSYKKNFPGVVAFAEDEGRKALSLGYTKTLSGRKRYYPPLPPPNDPDYNRLKAAVLRKASNVPVQGGSADIGKKAMIYVTNEFNRRFGESNAYIAIAVHDELQCVVKDVYAEEAKEILRRGMEEAFYFYIPESLCPIKVDTSIGEHWIH